MPGMDIMQGIPRRQESGAKEVTPEEMEAIEELVAMA